MALAIAVVLAACSGSDGDNGEAADDEREAAGEGGEVAGDDGSVSVQENPDNVLSAVIRVETDSQPAGLTATAEGHEVVLEVGNDAAEAHDLPLVGLRAETTYEVQVEAVDAEGAPVDAGGSVSFTSGPLPGDFPPIELEADTERTAEGLTLLSLKPWGPPDEDDADDGLAAPEQEEDSPGGYLAAVDQEGHVVWYHPTELGVLDARQVDGGNFVFTYDEVVVREIDVMGGLVNELAGRVATDIAPRDLLDRPRTTDDATPMDTDSAHHDAGPLPNGNVLLLSTEINERSGPPQCGEDGDEVTYPVISDVVAEVDPDTGEVVGEWPLADIYDPFDRPGEELCGPGTEFAPPNYFYPDEDRRDWTHGNSVMLDEERNALVVSLCRLNAVLAIRYEDDDDGRAS